MATNTISCDSIYDALCFDYQRLDTIANAPIGLIDMGVIFGASGCPIILGFLASWSSEGTMRNSDVLTQSHYLSSLSPIIDNQSEIVSGLQSVVTNINSTLPVIQSLQTDLKSKCPIDDALLKSRLMNINQLLTPPVNMLEMLINSIAKSCGITPL